MSPMAGTHRRPRRQRGAVSVVVGFSILMLLAALGLVLDLGHLFIVKTELQNAADACALGAAGQIATLSGSQAKAAGIAVGTKNRVDFQSEAVAIAPDDIKFNVQLNLADDSGWVDDITAISNYVRCSPYHQSGKSVVMWIMHLFGVYSWDMRAMAYAHLGPSQSHCAIPLAICAPNPTPGGQTPGESNDFGLTRGTWYSGRLAAGGGVAGNYDWLQYFGHGGHSVAELLAGNGQCDLGQAETVNGQQGQQMGQVRQAFNTRFGIYSGTFNVSDCQSDAGGDAASCPDKTGFAYTLTSWSSGANAYDSTKTVAGSFLLKRDEHAIFNPGAMDHGIPGNAISQDAYIAKGTDRRIVSMPVIDCNSWQPNGNNQPIFGWSCALMLAPIETPNDVVLEFLGPASAAPCVTSGMPGQGGVLTPQLVY